MKNKKYFLKKISDYAIVGGFGSLLIVGMTACEDRNSSSQSYQTNAVSNAASKKGAFVIIEKTPEGGYQIVNEFPSDNTTIVLRENGEERILSQEEIDKLVANENTKINNGTSNLTNGSEIHNGGMGLGEVLLASAAGAMIGAYIGNKLFGNSNYQQQRRTSYKSAQTYSKSKDSFNKNNGSSTAKSTQSKRRGFFGGSSRSSRSSFFGG